MLELTPHNFNAGDCRRQLEELCNFLNESLKIKERELLEFFTERINLILLMGSFTYATKADFYNSEVSLFGNEFRADFIVADSLRSKFTFIEFEDAEVNSIFKLKSKGSNGTSYEWSPRYEHGLGRVIDWYCRIDDFERTNKFEDYFSNSNISYTGLLAIGRDCHLQKRGLSKRFNWRREKTVVNSKSLPCFTFDELLLNMTEKLDELVAPID